MAQALAPKSKAYSLVSVEHSFLRAARTLLIRRQEASPRPWYVALKEGLTPLIAGKLDAALGEASAVVCMAEDPDINLFQNEVDAVAAAAAVVGEEVCGKGRIYWTTCLVWPRRFPDGRDVVCDNHDASVHVAVRSYRSYLILEQGKVASVFGVVGGDGPAVDTPKVLDLLCDVVTCLRWYMGLQGAAQDRDVRVYVMTGPIEDEKLAVKLCLECLCPSQALFSRRSIELVISEHQKNLVELSAS